MSHRFRIAAAVIGAVTLFVLIQLGSLALVHPFEAAELQPVEDPDDPTTPLLYIGAILIATVLMLAAFRYDLTKLVRGGIIVASIVLAWFVFSVVIPPVVTVAGLNLLAVLGALLIGLGLTVHPEWYVIDATGVVIGAAAGGLFGITFSILPVLILLVLLAIYDAISVYGTKHMLSLADGVMDVKVPVLLIIPISLSYSFLDDPAGPEAVDGEPMPDGDKNPETGPAGEALDGETGADQDSDEGDQDSADSPPGAHRRDALFIGLGDAVIPSILVASAAVFVPAPAIGVPMIALNLPALTAMIGTIAGLLVLLWMVLQGRAHAGLPLLCGGAIAGYLVGALAVGIPPVEAIGIAPYL